MKRGYILVCSMLLVAGIAYGEQTGKKDGFWDNLVNKLERTAPAKKNTTTTAVGGVRGAKNDEATDIYWKGKDKTVEMGQDELQKFNSAVEAKLKGDNEAALKQFEEFLTLYPQSAFRLEGLQAAEKIRQEIAAAKVPPVPVAQPAAAVPAPVEPAPAVAAPAVAPVVAPAPVQVQEAVPEPVK